MAALALAQPASRLTSVPLPNRLLLQALPRSITRNAGRHVTRRG